MRSLLILFCLLGAMCNPYPDNRNKDRNPDAQTTSDTVVHSDARRDSAAITDPNLHKSQHDSLPGGTGR